VREGESQIINKERMSNIYRKRIANTRRRKQIFFTNTHKHKYKKTKKETETSKKRKNKKYWKEKENR